MRKISVVWLTFLLGVSGSISVGQVTLLSESFELPVIDGQVATTPTNWVSSRTDKTGMWDGVMPGKHLDQFAFIDDYPNSGLYDGTLTTTASILSTTLVAGVLYTLTSDVAGEAAASRCEIQLLAGSNVVARREMSFPVVKSFNQTAQVQFLALPDHEDIGEMLSVRLRETGGAWDADVYFDNVVLTAQGTEGDTTAPTPGTLLWAQAPTPAAHSRIFMRAQDHNDPSLVQYLFSNTVTSVTSGWQDSPMWMDGSFSPSTSYAYRYRVRDKSVNLNEIAGWSSEEGATTDPTLIFYDSFEITKDYNTEPFGWDAAINSQADTNMPSDFITPYGNLAASIDGKSSTITDTTYLTNVLEASTIYTVVYHVSTRGADGGYDVAHGVKFYAGPVLLVQTNVGPVTVTNMTATNYVTYTTAADDPLLGQTLRIRLQGSERALTDGGLTGMDWQRNPLYDNLRIHAVAAPVDTNSPSPNPPQWLVDPIGVDYDMIYMRATNAVDASGVEYLFTNTVTGTSSGWQLLSYWCETNLPPSSTFSYRFKVRDRSENRNETQWSDPASGSTQDMDPYLVLRESFENPDVTIRQQLLPTGWYRVGGGTGYNGIWDTYYYRDTLTEPRPDGIFSGPDTYETYHGRQAGALFTSHRWQTTTNILDVALEAGAVYELSLSVAQSGGSSGDTMYASLLAAGQVLASTNAVVPNVDSDLYRFSMGLAFAPDGSHESFLGTNLVVELYEIGSSRCVIDNVRFRVIPPPPFGSLFIVR